MMARWFRNRYFVTLGAGYAQMAVMILVSLAQVPLFLSYLGKTQFGIWALAVQASIWLQLIDGGMNGALARYLIDYQSDKSDANLHKCLATGFRVLCLQGLLVFGIAAVLGQLGQIAFGLSYSDATVYQELMLILGLSAGIGFAGKVAQSWLYASQRLDLANVIGFVLALFEFALVWIMLHLGVGIMSLAWARLSMAILAVAVCWWISVRWVAFPWRLLLSGWDSAMFRRLAIFGGGMFLLTLGSLLLSMTQTAMTARYLGVAAAAVWATAPKVFMLAQQLVCKLWDYRIPYLSSLMAEGKTARISKEFLIVFGIIAYVGGGVSGVLAAINPAFLNLWTGGQIEWEPINNLLMAASAYTFLLVRCVTDLVLHTKKVGWMPLLMCGEGLLFVAAAAWLLPRYGLTGMLAASLVISGILRLPYAWFAFRKYLGAESPRAHVLLQKTLQGFALGGGLCLLLISVSHAAHSLDLRLVLLLQSVVAAVVLGPILFRLATSIRKA
jgi:O-antigen/teichoic acid export membrane protein